MGFSRERFKSEINKEFICEICDGVLHNPKMISKCEHMFCGECIELLETSNCPIDNETFDLADIRQPFSFFENLYSTLAIGCEFEECLVTSIPIIQAGDHERECEFNPANFVTCLEFCGRRIKTKDADLHHCGQYFLDQLSELKSLIDLREERKREKVDAIWSNLADLRSLSDSVMNELDCLNESEQSNQSNEAAQTEQQCLTFTPSVSLKVRIKEMFDVLSDLRPSQNQVFLQGSWRNDSLFQLLFSITNSELVRDILERCDLRSFYNKRNYHETIQCSRHHSLSHVISMAFLEWIEPFAITGKRILVITPIDHGFSVLLSQMGSTVISAINSDFCQHVEKILQRNFRSFQNLPTFIKLSWTVNKLISNILSIEPNPCFDCIISTVTFTHGEFNTLLRKLSHPQGFTLFYNEKKKRIENGSLNASPGSRKLYFDSTILVSTEELQNITNLTHHR